MFAQPILTAAAASKTARHILIGASSWAAAPGDFRRAGAYTAPASRGNRAAGDRERGSDFAGQLRSVRGQLHSWLAGGSSSAQAGWTECYCRRKSARHRSVEIARRKQYAGRLAEGEIPILLSQGADDKLVRPQVTKDCVAPPMPGRQQRADGRAAGNQSRLHSAATAPARRSAGWRIGSRALPPRATTGRNRLRDAMGFVASIYSARRDYAAVAAVATAASAALSALTVATASAPTPCRFASQPGSL
jgi:hypothetical protein